MTHADGSGRDFHTSPPRESNGEGKQKKQYNQMFLLNLFKIFLAEKSRENVGQQKNTSKPVNQTVFTGFLFCEAEIINISFLMKKS